jgi:cytochrome c-type protein NapB
MTTRIKTFLMAALFALSLGLMGGSDVQAQQVKPLEPGIRVDQTNQAPDIHNTVENQRLGRAYRQQPPLIPHRIDKYEIDLNVNQCLRCHDWPYSTQERAPKVSETHYIDRDGKRLDKVARTRWFCSQCHVPQTDAKPLVNNAFTPATPAN